MFYGSDFSSDEGLSDDNEYQEFKEIIKSNRRNVSSVNNSEAAEKKNQLKSVYIAVISGNVDKVFTEFDKGLDINTDLENGWTPLLLSATVGNLEIISGLIERGADVNKTLDDGSTPVSLLCKIASDHEPTKQNILSCVQLLVDKKADVNAIDNKRRTAIMFAANKGHLGIVKFLLPLVNKEAEDNQRWNVLFYAVDGNQVETTKFLLDEGFDWEKMDLRGKTVIEVAQANNSETVLELFPIKDDAFDIYYQKLNFEEIFQNKKPQFFSDICKILRGTRSESAMPVLWDKQIGLLEFLSMNETKLKEIGIPFPYQRNRIMGGLYLFHKRALRPQSIPYVKRDQLYLNEDVAKTVLTCVRQLIAMEASLKFVLENSDQKLSLPDSKEVRILISKNRRLIARLKSVSGQLVRKTEQWDLQLKPADRITKKRRNVPWCNLWLSVGVVSLVIIYKLKFQ